MSALKSMPVGLAACFALLMASPVSAEPPWWDGATEDVPSAAAQTGKPVVLYFQSPNAAECVRMDEETWQPMNPVWADLQFIWLKLEPRKDADFFKHWQINQVPQVVILDSEMRDQLRLRGFLNLDEMKDSLSRVQRGVPSVFTTVNGGVLPARSPILDMELLKRDPHKGHAYFENFDKYKLIGSISNPPFSPVVQASSRINTSRGSDRSPCLEIDSGSANNALIQIDISEKFADMEQVLGRIRVRAKLKSTSSLGRVPVDVMALYIVRTDDLDEESEQMYLASLSDQDQNVWREKEIISAPINLKENKAFILLSAPSTRMSFLVDDIVVDLIPYDDLIPFVEADARVQTLASLPTDDSDSDSSTNPDSFYDRLSAKAKVVEPTSVSNSVTRPVETGGANGPAAPARNQSGMTDAQIQETANYLMDLDEDARNEYIKSRGIKSKDRIRLHFMLKKMTSE